MTSTTNMTVTHWLSLISGIRYPLPHNYHNWNILVKFVWVVYADGVHAVFFLEIVSLFFRWLDNPYDLAIFCSSFGGIGYLLLFVLKLFIFRTYRREFFRLFDEMRSISDDLLSNPHDDGYLRHHDGYYVRMIRIGLVKGTSAYVAGVALIFIFIIRSYLYGVPENAMTAAYSWTPYDNTRNPMYTVTCLVELVAFCGVTMRNDVLDLLFWLMLATPMIQLGYMRRLLGIVLSRSEPEVDFIWWVKYHQRILKMIEDLKTITSPYLAVSYVTTLIVLTLAGLVAISTHSWTIFQQIIINGIVMSFILQLYFVSLTGDWLDECSETAAEEGLSDRLFTAEAATLRKDYLFVVARTKHSLRIRFGGINPLSCHTFGQLIRLTMTYFVTIVQLRSEEK